MRTQLNIDASIDNTSIDSAEVASWTAVAYLQDELRVAEVRMENLEAALVNARKIGAAIGVIMTREKVTYDEALRVLSQVSQRSNEKLRIVAERVILTGSTAPLP